MGKPYPYHFGGPHADEFNPLPPEPLVPYVVPNSGFVQIDPTMQFTVQAEMSERPVLEELRERKRLLTVRIKETSERLKELTAVSNRDHIERQQVEKALAAIEPRAESF